MRSNNVVKIISILVIILSLIIIGVIVYQQRSVVTSGILQTGKTIVNLFPFGSSNKQPSWNGGGVSTSSESVDQNGDSVPQKPKFEKLSDNPIASAQVIDLPSASSTLVYIEKETGNIFQIKNSDKPERISNLTIPEVFDAYFGVDKNKNIRVIVRSVVNDQLQLVSLNLNNNTSFGTSSDSSLQISKKTLSSNIKSIAVSPSRDQLLIVEELGNRAIVYTTDFDFKNKKIITILPFKDWIIFWSAKDTVVFQSKASNEVPGSVYFLNLKDKSFKKAGGEINGLTVNTSIDNKKIAYSKSLGLNFDLIVRDFSTNKSLTLSPKTLPEKCLWFSNNTALVCATPKDIPQAEYPDDWYQGNISFNDIIWLYYTETGQSTILYEPTEMGGLDLIPQASDSFNNFYFIDKKTYKLFRLNGSSNFSPDA